VVGGGGGAACEEGCKQCDAGKSTQGRAGHAGLPRAKCKACMVS
jgi:hypothetical protein